MDGEDVGLTIFYAIRLFITGYALLISFRCNKGFSFGGTLAALFFSEIYLIYKYATSPGCFKASKSKSRSKSKKSKKRRG